MTINQWLAYWCNQLMHKYIVVYRLLWSSIFIFSLLICFFICTDVSLCHGFTAEKMESTEFKFVAACIHLALMHLGDVQMPLPVIDWKDGWFISKN